MRGLWRAVAAALVRVARLLFGGARRRPRPTVACLLVVVGLLAFVVAVSASDAGAAGSDVQTTGTPAVDPGVVSAVAAAQSSGKPVEITDQTTDESVTYANPDGTFTAQIADIPVREQVNGQWQPIDPTLVSDGQGLHPKVASAGVEFSDGGSAPAATLTDGASSISLGFNAQTVPGASAATLPQPDVSGATATYPNVAPGTALRLNALNGGFEEQLVLRDRPTGPVTYRFPLTTRGLTATEDSDGTIHFTDASGQPVALSLPATMWDSQQVGSRPTHTASVATTLVNTSAGQELDVTPDAGFLQDPSTQYPVTIDPTQTIADHDDTWIEQGTSNRSRRYPPVFRCV